MKLKQIKQAQKNITEGGWVTNIPDLPGISLKVRALVNPDAAKIWGDAKLEMTEEQFKKEDVQNHLDARLLAETVILDWDGVEDDDGEVIIFDPAVALEMLLDPELILFRNGVVWASRNVAQEGQAALESARGN